MQIKIKQTEVNKLKFQKKSKNILVKKKLYNIIFFTFRCKIS